MGEKFIIFDPLNHNYYTGNVIHGEWNSDIRSAEAFNEYGDALDIIKKYKGYFQIQKIYMN